MQLRIWTYGYKYLIRSAYNYIIFKNTPVPEIHDDVLKINAFFGNEELPSFPRCHTSFVDFIEVHLLFMIANKALQTKLFYRAHTSDVVKSHVSTFFIIPRLPNVLINIWVDWKSSVTSGT